MGCKCDIRRGMTFLQLRSVRSCKPYVCPALDRARRNARQPTAEERAADDLALAKQLGIGKGVGL